MELRIITDEGDNEYSGGGAPLGSPGDEGNAVVLLALIELDGTIGSEAFEVTDAGEMVCTVGGRHYIVAPALVHKDGRVDDTFAFVGVPTEYAPGSGSA